MARPNWSFIAIQLTFNVAGYWIAFNLDSFTISRQFGYLIIISVWFYSIFLHLYHIVFGVYPLRRLFVWLKTDTFWSLNSYLDSFWLISIKCLTHLDLFIQVLTSKTKIWLISIKMLTLKPNFLINLDLLIKVLTSKTKIWLITIKILTF